MSPTSDFYIKEDISPTFSISYTEQSYSGTELETLLGDLKLHTLVILKGSPLLATNLPF